MIVELVHHGFSESFVLDMPMNELHRFYEVSMKVRSRNAFLDANVLRAAAQGTDSSFKKVTKAHKDIANKRLALYEGGDDSDRILKGRKQAGF